MTLLAASASFSTSAAFDLSCNDLFVSEEPSDVFEQLKRPAGECLRLVHDVMLTKGCEVLQVFLLKFVLPPSWRGDLGASPSGRPPGSHAPTMMAAVPPAQGEIQILGIVGIVTNWNDKEKILHHTFYNELRVAP